MTPSLRPTRRFFRSIRLERDLDEIAALEGYLLTPQVRHTLAQIAVGLQPQSTERAWTLTGPYGSGKSAFSLLLSHLLANQGKKSELAWTLLQQQDSDLATQLREVLPKNQGMLPVVLTMRRASLGMALLEGLVQSLKRLGLRKADGLAKVLEDDVHQGQIDSRRLLGHLGTLMDIATARKQGVLFILDELGKTLEHAARNPGEDIFLLQELAEFAARSHDHPFLLVGILHQGFEQYEEGLDLSGRREWAKVQGRFRNLAFLEPPEQQIRLASQAIAAHNFPRNEELALRLAQTIHSLIDAGFTPPGLKAEEFSSLAMAAYPLNPIALAALPYLFRRFAQNERSLFAYLLSQEPFGLQDLAAQDPTTLVSLPSLFDYFIANLSGSLLRQATARRWLEVTDAIERSRDPIALDIEVIKTVGILGILGEISQLLPSQQLISLALGEKSGDSSVRESIERLQTQSLLVFRRYNQTFKIWEGSDVDVEARLEEGRLKATGQPLSETLGQYLTKRPMVARRHSYQHGCIRYFEVRYLDEPVSVSGLLPREGADGVVACCLSSNPEQARVFAEWAASSEVAELEHLLVVIPQHMINLRSVATEYAALHWVWNNTPELRDDRVARREIAERLVTTERSLMGLVDFVMDPRPEPQGAQAQWVHRGEIKPTRWPVETTHLLSEVMDVLYYKSPVIKNELINRRSLSSAAAAARRSLIEAMLTAGGQAMLGITGFPPERSVYESVLLSSGLHRPHLEEVLAAPDQAWLFGAPSADDKNRLIPVWEELQRIVFGSVSEPYPVKDLFDHLAKPPYGVLSGVAPVILTAFLLAHPDAISLYRENVFIPEPSIADFEVMLRRPEVFALAGSRLTGDRSRVVERMARSLQTRPSVVPVVRALIKMVKSFPDTAWKTQRLPGAVMELRKVFDQARSPEKLLFTDIPQALGYPPFSEQDSETIHTIERFFDDLNNAIQAWAAFAPRQIETARDKFLTTCDLPQGPEGWRQLQEIAEQLSQKAVHANLKPLISRLGTPGDQAARVEGVLALIANRPPRSWTDADSDAFIVNSEVFGEQLRHARQLLGVLTEAETIISQDLVERLRKELVASIPNHVLKVALAQLIQKL